MKRSAAGWIVLLGVTAGFGACKKEPPPRGAKGVAESTSAENPKSSSEIDPGVLKAFGVLPAAFESKDNPLTDAKIALGRMLFFETRLSLSRELSCNSCHLLDHFGVDGKRVSEGHKGQLGKRNANSVYNAAGQFVQFWDGRAANVEEQSKGPIVNPVEMAMPSDARVIADATLETIPEYVDAFKKAFPGDKNPVSFDNLAKAIGAFERKLVTPSRWDAYQKGDKTALTQDEKAGFNKFVETGCMTCHVGPLVGGSMFQKVGLVVPWPSDKDLGRYEVTKQESDKMFFKVPSLRNVEKTAPYFHDGSVAKLEDAVKMMAKHQLGKTLSDADVRSILAWLKTLTGAVPTDYIAKPELPPSTKETVKVRKAAQAEVPATKP